MLWMDVGGYTTSQHIVTRISHGEYTNVLCGADPSYGFAVKRKRALPRCKRCLAAWEKLKRLIEAEPGK